MKKFCTCIFYIFLCSCILTACGEPESNAASSVKAIYDLYILGDTTGISSLGMSDSEIKTAQTDYDNSLKATIRSNFSASGQKIDDETLDELCAARKEALSKLNASAEVTSESEGKATVILHTTYFDESKLDQDAFYSAREAANQSGLATIEEQQVFLMNTYTQNLIAAYKDVTPSKDTNDVTVDCVIQDNSWVPVDMSEFGSDLALAITGPAQTSDTSGE